MHHSPLSHHCQRCEETHFMLLLMLQRRCPRVSCPNQQRSWTRRLPPRAGGRNGLPGQRLHTRLAAALPTGPRPHSGPAIRTQGRGVPQQLWQRNGRRTTRSSGNRGTIMCVYTVLLMKMISTHPASSG